MTRNQTRIATAAGVVGVLIVAAIWLASRDQTANLVATPLYPELAAAIPSAQRITLSTAAEQPAVELKRNGDSWTVTQRDE